MKINPNRLVGILLDPNSKNPFQRNRVPMIYREFFSSAVEKDIQLLFFFSKDFNPLHQYVSGWLLLNERWKYIHCPAPKVIYNRINYRFLENRNYNQTFFHKLRQSSRYTLFNTRYLNKSETFTTLQENEKVQGYLPKTKPYTSEELAWFLGHYSEVFIKPNAASRGEGIIKIETISPQYYRYKKYQKGKNSVWHEGNQETVIKRIHPLIGKYHYIIQEGIALCAYQNQVFDLRAQAQKNQYGRWEMTGFGVRLAAPQSFVTHIPNGGKLKKLQEVLNSQQCQQVEKELKDLCLNAAEILEKNLSLHLGILSFDVGIDRNTSQLKLIEINSKPAIFDELHIRKRHWDLLTDYFTYLLIKKDNETSDFAKL